MICFISDLHLGDTFVKTELLNRFLQKVREIPDLELVLVGDSMDFWRNPKLGEFQELFKGVHKKVLVGNHDSFLEFSQILGCPSFRKLELYGKTYSLIVFHGDCLDSVFAYPGEISRAMDNLIYYVSSKIRYNLRNLVRWVCHWFYDYQGFNDKIKDNYLGTYDAAIVGHTHFGGVTEFDKFKIFNLGSWYKEPYAFFLREDEKYAFFEITETVLVPAEKDFKGFR